MFLRIFANCVEDEVSLLSSDIEAALVHFDPQPATPPKQYWKAPGLFEFTYRLSSPTRDIWNELVTDQPSGWHVLDNSDERSAVWNRGADHVFLVPAVRWAELAGQA